PPARRAPPFRWFRAHPAVGGAVPAAGRAGQVRRLDRPPADAHVTAARPRQIVVMGGGSFSVEPDGSLLDAYVLNLSGKPRPRICFVPTASGDSSMYITKFYEAFGGRAEARHLGLFGRRRADMAAVLASQDIIYVGGGNTANMLAVWRVHGVDRMMRGAWGGGGSLTGGGGGGG